MRIIVLLILFLGCIPQLVHAQSIWTGAASADWHNSANWQDGQVPTAVDDVIIPASPTNAPVINNSSGAFCGDLTLNGSALSFGTTAFNFLRINGNLTLNAGTLRLNTTNDAGYRVFLRGNLQFQGGNIIGGTDTLILTGSVIQQITRTTSTLPTVRNLKLNNQSTVLLCPLRVTSFLNYRTGRMTANDDNPLIIAATCVVSGGSNISNCTYYKVETRTPINHFLPLSDNSGTYRPVRVSTLLAGLDTSSVEISYINRPPDDDGYDTNRFNTNYGYLCQVQNVEYWSVKANGANPAIRLAVACDIDVNPLLYEYAAKLAVWLPNDPGWSNLGGTLTNSLFDYQMLYADRSLIIPNGITAVFTPAIGDPIPLLPLNNLLVCDPSNITFVLSFNVGETHWYDAPIGGNLLGIGDVYSLFITKDTIVFPELHIQNCVSNRIAYKAFLKPPFPDYTIPDYERCDAGPVVVNVRDSIIPASSTSSYIWDDTINTNNPNYTFYVTESQIHSLRLMKDFYDPDNPSRFIRCFDDPVFFNIIVNRPADPPIVSVNPVCKGDSVRIRVQPVAGATEYCWYNDVSDTALFCSTSPNWTFIAPQDPVSIFYVNARINNCLSRKAEIKIEIKDPVREVKNKVLPNCATKTYSIISSGINADTFKWYRAQDTINPFEINAGLLQDFAGADSVIFVRLFNSAGCFTRLYKIPLPPLNNYFPNAGKDTNACNNAILLRGNKPPSFSRAFWKIDAGAGGRILARNDSVITFYGLPNQNYVLSYSFDSTICGAANDVVNVRIDSVSDIPVMGPYTFCNDRSSGLLSIPSVVASKFIFERRNDDGTYSVVLTTDVNRFTVPTNTLGNFKFRVKLVSGKCESAYRNFEVNVVRNSVKVNAGEDITAAKNTKVLFSGSVSGAFTSIIWNPSEGLSDVTILNPICDVKENRTYNLYAEDSNGCYSVDEINVIATTTEQLDVRIPNTFTPNNDNVNDNFNVSNPSDYAGMSLKVFDRWGRQIYTNLNGNGWDGKISGDNAPIGAYFYEIKIPSIRNVFSGMVTLLR
jgi:gliding motility-associated-like protein